MGVASRCNETTSRDTKIRRRRTTLCAISNTPNTKFSIRMKRDLIRCRQRGGIRFQDKSCLLVLRSLFLSFSVDLKTNDICEAYEPLILRDIRRAVYRFWRIAAVTRCGILRLTVATFASPRLVQP
ncbi:hypothetical protein U1Q18_050745 [Sarracenia purpurea var. burkii]